MNDYAALEEEVHREYQSIWVIESLRRIFLLVFIALMLLMLPSDIRSGLAWTWMSMFLLLAALELSSVLAVAYHHYDVCVIYKAERWAMIVSCMCIIVCIVISIVIFLD